MKTTARGQSRGSDAQIALHVPNGWRAEPAHESVDIPHDESKDASFQVFPSELKESQTHIRAELTSGKKAYAEGYTVVTREDLGSAYYFQPAVQRVSIVDVKIPANLKLGYILGAGDDIPTVLEQIGMNVTIIPAEKIAAKISRSTTPSSSAFAPTTRKKMSSPTARSYSITFPTAGRWSCSTTTTRARSIARTLRRIRQR